MSANSRGAAERSAREGLLLATAAAMLWGTVGVASKLLPDGVTLSSFHLGFARLAIAAPLLVLFGVLMLGRALWAIPRAHGRGSPLWAYWRPAISSLSS
jgi:drug/metabolite transporter (DMT)-like permease